MKTLITLLFALGLTLFTSCTKDESYQPIEEQTIDSVYVLKQFLGSTTWEAILMNELQKPTVAHFIDYKDSHRTYGYYVPALQDAMTITSAGSQTFMMLILNIMLKMQ